MKLTNKTVLITGGTTGIGLATARLLHAEGARVIVTGVSAERIAAASNALGPEVTVLHADLRNAADLDAVIDIVKARFGRLDILFANAGVGTVAALDAVTEEQIDNQFSITFHSKLGLSEQQLGAAAAGIEAAIPLGRFGQADEIAKAVLFLASDDASFVTGSEIVADGGLAQF